MIWISYNFLRILHSNALILDISFLLLNTDSKFMIDNIKYRYVLFLVFLLHIWVCKGNIMDTGVYDYGLTFLAHSTNQDQRTNLDLTSTASLSFPEEGFSVGFDIKLRNELYTYGYVVRVIADDSSCFDFISYLLYSRFNMVLTDKDRVVKNTEIVDSVKIVADKWIHVDLLFTREGIHIVADGIKAEIAHSLDSFKDIKIYFGGSKHPRFFSTDVPPMTIRNITLADSHGKALYQWDLAAHDKDETFDNIKNRKAFVRNGVWEIDKHTKWAAMSSLIVQGPNPQVAYDDAGGLFFIVGESQLFIYDVKSNHIDSITYKGHSFIGASSQVIYDAKRNRLLSYTPDLKDLNIYDFSRQSWTLDTPVVIDTRQHHNRIINRKRDELIVFGGYGNHRYNSQLNRIKLEKPEGWTTTSLDSCIYPRYLSAMGQESDDELLIMGGYGNQSGKQEESPGNFYDLYRLDLQTGKCNKLWEFVNDREHFTFGNSMIVDTLSNSVYALTYNNDRYNTLIYLSRFDIRTKQPVQEVMSDSITYNFLDIHSYCDMFLHKETSSIYAVVLQEKEPGESKVEFYKLAFPPLSKEDILPHQTTGTTLLVLIAAGVFVFICLLGGALWLLRKKKKDTGVIATLADESEENPVKLEVKERKFSSVLLLGGFQVFDKQGCNITGDFTPTLKQLFLFLLLNSVKNEKGTTSQCLDETFWFDMSKSSASNNRNVNIRKLRLIIDKIGDISIHNKNGYWYLHLGKEIVCDYQEVMKLLNQVKAKNAITDKKVINEIISLASAGALLPNVSAEWIDEYKSAYYVLLTEILLSMVNHPDIQADSRLLLRISDVILLVDNIDEDAIRTKCKVLYQMGQKGLSKQCFDKFCVEYERLLNAKPDFSYDDIINSL